MVTAVLAVWKRNHLVEQIEALLNQTTPPNEIWVYHCCAFIEPDLELLEKYPTVKYQFNSHDLGFFGRFGLGLLISTPFLYIINDDVIPSVNWIEYSVNLCSSYNSIISSAGRIIPANNYNPEFVVDQKYLSEYFIGDNDIVDHANKCANDTFVDFGVCDWFIKTEWLNYFWSVKPYTFNTGEDIHLSVSCHLKGEIRTMVPMQDGRTSCGNLKRGYGDDIYASWRRIDFLKKREELLQYWIDDQSWKPLLW